MTTETDNQQVPDPAPQQTPKRRGRPPGAKDSKPRKRRKDAQAKPITQGGENLQKGGECLPVESREREFIERTGRTETQQQDNKPAGEQQTGEHWHDILAEREKGMEKAINAILPGHEHAHAIQRLLLATSDGQYWDDASKTSGIAWSTWGGYLRQYPLLAQLWHEAQASGDSWRVQRLEAVTYERAANGWEEPVFHRGEIVGHVRRFSDRLAEIHLRASNPAKYAPAPEDKGSTQAVQVVIYTNPRGSQGDTKPQPDAPASADSPAK